MKHFLVFWDSGNDPELVARHYAKRAQERATGTKKSIGTNLVDTTGSDPDKQFWDSPNTIECVTVDGTTKKDTYLNPLDPDIDQMVDNL